jgi:hypothetical protein
MAGPGLGRGSRVELNSTHVITPPPVVTETVRNPLIRCRLGTVLGGKKGRDDMKRNESKEVIG